MTDYKQYNELVAKNHQLQSLILERTNLITDEKKKAIKRNLDMLLQAKVATVQCMENDGSGLAVEQCVEQENFLYSEILQQLINL